MDRTERIVILIVLSAEIVILSAVADFYETEGVDPLRPNMVLKTLNICQAQSSGLESMDGFLLARTPGLIK
jgi:hypothetical protein